MENKNFFSSAINTALYIIIGIIIGVSIMLLKQNQIFNWTFQNSETRFSKFSAIDYILQNEYIDQSMLNESMNKMVDGALEGYVNALGDPYTTYLKKEDNSELSQELNDDAGFAGIGAVIGKDNDEYATISEVIKNSPAAKSGLLPLDRIIMIDDASVQGLTVNEVVNLIRGEKGTEVSLLIWREGKNGGSPMQFWIPITRDEVNIPSVTSQIIQKSGQNLLYVEVSIISNQTTALLLEEIRDSLEKISTIDGIILDLRGNGGGYMDEAIKFLGHFFQKGTVLAKSKYIAYDDIDHLSEGRGELGNYPIVVIVDQLTASAGEIIALTLQENGKTVVGMPTFGKGTIQSVQDFSDGSSLKYTIGKWYSPNDVNINGTGIIPDIEIARDYEKYNNSGIDNQLEKAEDVLLNEILKNKD